MLVLLVLLFSPRCRALTKLSGRYRPDKAAKGQHVGELIELRADILGVHGAAQDGDMKEYFVRGDDIGVGARQVRCPNLFTRDDFHGGWHVFSSRS